jgi:hypothetical protein
MIVAWKKNAGSSEGRIIKVGNQRMETNPQAFFFQNSYLSSMAISQVAFESL